MPQRTTRGVATAVVALLAAQVALSVVIVIALIHRLDILHRIQNGELVTQAQGNAADGAVRISAGLEGLVFVATVIVWCIWQHRAQRDAIDLATGGLRFTPGWAVGWWFVPFANLVKPFQTVRELWKASHGGGAWQRLPTWPLIGWWWAAWIVSNVHVWFGSSGFNVGLGFGSFGSPSSLSDYISRDSWEIVSLVVRVVAAVLAIAIVRSVDRLQVAGTAATIPPMPGSVRSLPDPPALPMG